MQNNWWSGEKIFFGCKKCGGCCERKGVLLFNDKDISRAAEYLEMKEEVFVKTYLRYGLTPNKSIYHFISNSKKSPCPFLLKGKCRIHDAKPDQCKSYPFWPHLLRDKDTFTREKFFCKGIGSGNEVDLNKIVSSEDNLNGATKDQIDNILALINCGENYKIEQDGKCKSKKCIFGKEEKFSEKIQSEGCFLYHLYLKLEEQNALRDKV